MKNSVEVSFRSKLRLGAGLVVASAIGAMLLGTGAALSTGLRAAAGVTCLALAVAAATWLMRMASPLDRCGKLLGELAVEAGNLEAVAVAQVKLEDNINLLRDLLYKNGDPHVVDGQLCFGNYVVNDNNQFVDEVQSMRGGAATVFLADTRIATNVKDQQGHRTIGSKLDRAGAAFDKVFNHGMTYRGEVTLFGSPYISIYEPIVTGETVIGILFVAVKKADAVSQDDEANASASAMTKAVEDLRAIILRRDEAMRNADEQRGAMLDRRRKAKAMERVTAKVQATVVASLSSALERLAKSDLTSNIEAAFPSEYQKIKDDFGEATNALRHAMGAIGSESDLIHRNSIQIADSVDDLSRRTESQAASLEETAAALNQITDGVRQTAGQVAEARRVVTAASTTAEDSSDIMRQAVGAMNEIKNSSQQIGQIISVINEIAFQTNLLALNAGVEAARAGEGGRGFAVVAAEVRALAQRSAEAAREIRLLIETSSEHVTQGVVLIGDAGTTLETILTQVKGVNDIVNTIALSTQDQAQSLQEINMAVTQMDKFTQQNAAMVEQTMGSSRALADEAAKLQSLVEQFRTKESTDDRIVGFSRRSTPSRGASAVTWQEAANF